VGIDFSPVTEVPGNRATAEQLEMIHTRYHLARGFAEGKDVLEVACGPGRGLGYLAEAARTVTGGDCTEALVEKAKEHYGGRVGLRVLDAQDLPFGDASFDLVVLFEALYYIPDAARFAREAWRVLRPRGRLVLCSANKEWHEFNPSPFSVRYFSADELKDFFGGVGFTVEVLLGFESRSKGAVGKAVGYLRRAAVRLRLIPGSMKGKALLKRFFYGELKKLSPEIDASAPVRKLTRHGGGAVPRHKVIYAVCRKF